MTTCIGPAATPAVIPDHTDRQMRAMRRIARAFAEAPETVPQTLVEAAVELCHADSAGLAVEEAGLWTWAALAGECGGAEPAAGRAAGSALARAVVPLALEPGEMQRFPDVRSFFDLAFPAAAVAAGILLPWQAGELRGVFCVMAHSDTQAPEFDEAAVHTLTAFAAAALRLRQQQSAVVRQAADSAAADMANHLAHQINNPLQALTNVAYLAAEGQGASDARSLGRVLSAELKRLSSLVNKLLSLPGRSVL